jgi:hypothetical protein
MRGGHTGAAHGRSDGHPADDRLLHVIATTRMTRPLRVFAALGTLAALTLAGEGCAVMTGGDCADKASCADSDTASTGDGPTAQADAATEDATAEDATAEDATSDATTGSDATVEADTGQAGGPRDTGPADTRAPVPDGCISTGTEDCTNGIDDNCDGWIDCEDPLCQPAFACVPPVPSGWIGPVELWQATNPATRPACDTGYGGTTRDGLGGFNAAPARCTCTCTASGQVCSRGGTLFMQTNCANSCATVTPAANGACTPVAGACGSEGSFSLSSATPSGGTCTATSSTTVPPVSWATSERVCPYTGPTNNSGGCGGAGGSCVRAPTGGAGGYGAGACVYSTADPPPAACPAGFTAGLPLTFYTSDTDTRGCAASCACSGTPSNGGCSGTIDIYGNLADGGCTGAHDTYDAGGAPVCQCYGQTQCGTSDAVVLNNMPGFVQAHYVVTPGTCGMPAQPAPTGSAVPTGPTTVCCM